MDELPFLLGRVFGYGLILFWCYSAWITGGFLGQSVKAPFQKEPNEQDIPTPKQDKEPKKTGKFVYPVIEDYKDEHKIIHPFESGD